MPRTPISLEVDALIRQAIYERRLLQLVFNGQPRVVEPHDYGVIKGDAKLLAYQVGGVSSSGDLPDWRFFRVAKMENLEILDTRFAGAREPEGGGHHDWDELFMRVEDPPNKKKK